MTKSNRLTAGSYNGVGRSNNQSDFATRSGHDFTAVEYPIFELETIYQLELSFWYRTIGIANDTPDGYYQIVDSTDINGLGFKLGLETVDDVTTKYDGVEVYPR